MEVKYDIFISYDIVRRAYDKIVKSPVQRYYILSTKERVKEEIEQIENLTTDLRNEHGCELIINGIIPTIKYYLRLIKNADLFLDKYTAELQVNEELQEAQKIAWNRIVKEYNDSKKT